MTKEIAQREAEKASAEIRERSAADAEKNALIEKFSKPSGVSDEERLKRSIAIINRAAKNGLTFGRDYTVPPINYAQIMAVRLINASRVGKTP